MIDKEAKAEYFGEWIVYLSPDGIWIKHSKHEEIWDKDQDLELRDADFENIMKNLFWLLSRSEVLDGTGIVMSGIIQARNAMCGTKIFDNYSRKFDVEDVEYEDPNDPNN